MLFRINLQENEAAVDAVVDVISHLPKMSGSSASTAAPSSYGVLPPYSLDAKTASEIYPLSGWLAKPVLSSLEHQAISRLISGETEEDIAEEEQDEEDEETEAKTPVVHPRVVLECIKLVQGVGDSKLKKQRARILTFLELVIRLQKTRPKQVRDTIEELEVSEAVKNALKDRFLEAEGRRLSHTTQCQHRLLCLLCIILLTVCNFNVSKVVRDALAKDLRVTGSKLNTYFKEVGCNFSRENSACVLTVPFKLPRLRQGRGGGS